MLWWKVRTICCRICWLLWSQWLSCAHPHFDHLESSANRMEWLQFTPAWRLWMMQLVKCNNKDAIDIFSSPFVCQQPHHMGRCLECLANGFCVVLGRNLAFQVSPCELWRWLNNQGVSGKGALPLLCMKLAETFRHSLDDFLNCLFKRKPTPRQIQCHSPGGHSA